MIFLPYSAGKKATPYLYLIIPGGFAAGNRGADFVKHRD
jgi:hypothetical protein